MGDATVDRIRESAEAALRRNEAERDRLIRRLDTLDAYGEDIWPNGTVIRFDKTSGGVSYSYASLKAADKWYTTSMRGRHIYEDWAELLAFFAGDAPVVEFWVAVLWSTPDTYDDVLARVEDFE